MRRLRMIRLGDLKRWNFLGARRGRRVKLPGRIAGWGRDCRRLSWGREKPVLCEGPERLPVKGKLTGGEGGPRGPGQLPWSRRRRFPVAARCAGMAEVLLSLLWRDGRCCWMKRLRWLISKSLWRRERFRMLSRIAMVLLQELVRLQERVCDSWTGRRFGFWSEGRQGGPCAD